MARKCRVPVALLTLALVSPSLGFARTPAGTDNPSFLMRLWQAAVAAVLGQPPSGVTGDGGIGSDPDGG